MLGIGGSALLLLPLPILPPLPSLISSVPIIFVTFETLGVVADDRQAVPGVSEMDAEDDKFDERYPVLPSGGDVAMIFEKVSDSLP